MLIVFLLVILKNILMVTDVLTKTISIFTVRVIVPVEKQSIATTITIAHTYAARQSILTPSHVFIIFAVLPDISTPMIVTASVISTSMSIVPRVIQRAETDIYTLFQQNIMRI
jgi:hypothetical protein